MHGRKLIKLVPKLQGLLLVSCTGTRLTARTGTGNRFSVRFFDKWKTGTRTVSNKNDMRSLNHDFNISSNCLSGNNHALSQYSPNPVNFLSIRRVYFYSNVANHSSKPPCFPFPFLLCTGNPRDVTTESVIMRLRWLAYACAKLFASGNSLL